MSSATLGPMPPDFERGALRGEIDRTAAIGVRDERGDALRQQRLRLAQRAVPDALRPRANARR